MTAAVTMIGHYLVIPASARFDPEALSALVDDARVMLARSAAEHGVTLLDEVTLSVTEESELHRAMRQDDADAWADEQGVERWTVPPLSFLLGEARCRPLGRPLDAPAEPVTQ